MRGEGKKENWLLIKEDDTEAIRNSNSEFLQGLSFSVKSGRSMGEIASGDNAKRKTRASAALKAIKPAGLTLSGIAITHPDRVISETGHVTKGELAEYYSASRPSSFLMSSGAPSLLRCPSGIDGECFFQRNPGKGLGADVKLFEFRHKGRKYEYLYIEDEKGLLEVIQMGAIELHPWGATVESIDYPDRMIFDLDPAPELPFEAVKLAAQDLRRRLQDKGLDSTLKCSGGKGLHVTVPLAGKDKWPAVKSFAGSLAAEMVAAAPDAYVATMSKAKRISKIFIDYLRNDYTATAIADYGVRARPGAPVALPLDWKELKTLKSASQFTMKDVLKRLREQETRIGRKGETTGSPCDMTRANAQPDQTQTTLPDPRLSNAEIADRLAGLAQLLSTQKENPWKIKAYRRAAAKIRTLSESVDELVRDDADLTAYAGIGEAIASAIREIVMTGTLGKLEKLRSAASPELASISAFLRLEPKRILRVYKKLGIGSVEELREKLENGEIEKHLGPRMAQHVRQGLTEAHAMLLYRAHDLCIAVEEFLLEKCGVRRVEAVGDYRRRVDVIEELAFIVETDNFPGVVSRLERYGGRTPLLSATRDTASYALSSGVILRIHTAARENWGLALVRDTGSKAHLRKLATVTGSTTTLESNGPFPDGRGAIREIRPVVHRARITRRLSGGQAGCPGHASGTRDH